MSLRAEYDGLLLVQGDGDSLFFIVGDKSEDIDFHAFHPASAQDIISVMPAQVEKYSLGMENLEDTDDLLEAFDDVMGDLGLEWNIVPDEWKDTVMTAFKEEIAKNAAFLND